MISARALGALYACVLSDVNPTSKGLKDHFKSGGRHVWDSVTDELVQAGFLFRKTYSIGNRLQTECRITDLGREYIMTPVVSKIQASESATWSDNQTPWSEFVGVGKSDSLFRQSQLDSYKNLNKLESKIWSKDDKEEYQTLPFQVEQVSEGTDVPYDFFDSNPTSEYVADRAEDLKKAKERFKQQKKEITTRRITDRSKVATSLWTCSDIAYEFSYRLEFYWNIPPWAIKSTNFIQAIGGMRNRLDTNGEIECAMLDLFFDSVDFEKYTSADPVWRLFLFRADELANKARGMVRSEIEAEAADTQAQKSQEWLYE